MIPVCARTKVSIRISSSSNRRVSESRAVLFLFSSSRLNALPLRISQDAFGESTYRPTETSQMLNINGKPTPEILLRFNCHSKIRAVNPTSYYANLVEETSSKMDALRGTTVV